MKTGKLITFKILILILMINTLILYFGGGTDPFSFTLAHLKVMALGAFMFFLAWLMSLFANCAYLVPKAIHKKNYLRINALILLILVIASIVSRIMELIAGTFCLICWFQTVLYIILLIITISMLRDLHALIRDLFRV